MPLIRYESPTSQLHRASNRRSRVSSDLQESGTKRRLLPRHITTEFIAPMSPNASLPSLLRNERKAVSCLHCYKNKERCSLNRGQKACDRCVTLGKECTPRQKKRMGRHPKTTATSYGDFSILDLAILGADRTRSPTITHMSNPDFRQMDNVLKTSEHFFATHRYFMMGETFTDDFYISVRKLFSNSPWILAEAYTATLQLFKYRQTKCWSMNGLDLSAGIHSLQFLRSSPSAVAKIEDAVAVIMLGQVVYLYNILVPCASTHAIARSTILAVREWYPALMRHPQWDTISLTPLLLDTVECLLRREVPIVRMPEMDRCIVDRCLGVSASLLPLLYDLCERSYEVKSKDFGGRVGPSSVVDEDPYEDIEQRIKAWTPRLPADFVTKYKPSEVTLMLTQVRTYRLASLLVVHRLRFPLGVKDPIAYCHAESILNELALLTSWSPGGATGIGLDFPLLLATVEIPDVGEAVLREFDSLRFRRPPTDEIMAAVKVVWKAKEMGYDGPWFDLVQDQLPGVIIP